MRDILFLDLIDGTQVYKKKIPEDERQMLISIVDNVIFEHYFTKEFEELSAPMFINSIRKDFETQYKNLSLKHNFNIINLTIDISNAISKKVMSEFKSVYEMHPGLSYLLEETVTVPDKIIPSFASQQMLDSIILIYTRSKNISSLKRLFGIAGIKKKVYFTKKDSHKPEKQIFFELEKLLSS